MAGKSRLSVSDTGIAEWLADRATEDVIDFGALDAVLDDVTDADEEERIIRQAVDRRFNALCALFNVEDDDKAPAIFTLPPIKPLPHIDSAELDAVVRRVSDPAEQDRLAKQFVKRMKKD